MVQAEDSGATPKTGRFARAVGRLSSWRWLRALGLSPVIARPGYWFATVSALIWGAILGRFHVRRQGGVVIADNMPRWAFGRGGTTVGAVYLTRGNVSPGILEHEAVHRAQWKKYGLAMIPLYIAAGQNARTNRFEIEAGLRKGGYL